MPKLEHLVVCISTSVYRYISIADGVPMRIFRIHRVTLLFASTVADCRF